MPLATKIGPKLITEDFAKQIQNNLDTPISTETVKTEAPKQVTEILNNPNPAESPKESRGKYSDVANLHFSRGKKAEFKGFFSSNEVTLVQGVELSVSYIIKEVRAGRLTISRNGIEKVGE